VAISSLQLREGPSTQYLPAGSLKKGDEFFLVGQNAECRWLQVSNQEKISGWFRNDGKAVQLSTPCAEIPPGTYRPATGIIMPVQGTRGWNQIRTDNGDKQDVVFVLTDLNMQPIVSAYVRSNEKFTISKVYDGVYYLFYTTGADWNGREFTKGASYRRFEGVMPFVSEGTSPTGNTYWYNVYTITLPTTRGGTIAVTASQFPKVGK